MALMKKLIPILLLLALNAKAAIFQNYFTTNANPTVGGGGIVSNVFLTPPALDTDYTNTTPYYSFVSASFKVNSPVGTGDLLDGVNLAVDPLPHNNASYTNVFEFFRYRGAQGITNSVSVSGWIPPGARYNFDTVGGNVVVDNTLGNSAYSVVYVATNGSTGGAGDVTQVGLAAGSYPIKGSSLTGTITTLSNGAASFGRRNIMIGTNMNDVSQAFNSVIIASDNPDGVVEATNSVFINPSATSGGIGGRSVAIGAGAAAGYHTVAIGNEADAFGNNCVVIGSDSSGNDGDQQILIGASMTTVTYTNCIGIGTAATPQADNSFRVSSIPAIVNAYIQGKIYGNGNGLTNITPNIGSNSVAVVNNISIYLTNQDGTVYRLAAQRIVP